MGPTQSQWIGAGAYHCDTHPSAYHRIYWCAQREQIKATVARLTTASKSNTNNAAV